MNDKLNIDDEDYSYIFSSDDYNIVSATKKLLWKTTRCESLTGMQLEVVARALQVFEDMPTVPYDFDIQIQITGPRRMFGEHEIYHWWHIEIENRNATVLSGGHFYRPTTGGDTFTSMTWCASPGFATEFHDYLDSIKIVDDAQPFDLDVESIDFLNQGYSLEIYENGEELFCNDDENDDVENTIEDEFPDTITLNEVVKNLETVGVECCWADKASLYAVDLQENSLTDSLYGLFEKILTLRTLDARNTDISDRTIAFINHLESLEWLCLRNTAVTDEGLRHLQALQNLQHLDLIGASVLGPGLSYLRGLTNLRGLYISGFQHHDRWLEMLRREIPQCSIYLN